MNIIRKTLTGAKTSFEFEGASQDYIVKNFTSGDILVAFDSTATDANSIKIPSMMGQLCINNDDKANTVYITGTGEVEVQQI